jgi:hypothetical protein
VAILRGMSPDEMTWVLREDRVPAERHHRETRWAQAGWLLDELRFVWRQAQEEATAAYEHWSRTGSRDAYAVYVAARDRADAAEDALGQWHAGE